MQNVNWQEVGTTAGICLAVLVAAMALPYARDVLAQRTPHTPE
jgi:hypothetical protein